MACDGFAYRITKGEGSTSSSDCRCNEGNLVSDAGLEAGVLWSTRGSQFEDERIEGHLPSGTRELRDPLFKALLKMLFLFPRWDM